MGNFKVDKRAIENLANQGMKKVRADLQRVFDGVLRSHGGLPQAEVEAALRSAMRRSGFTPDRSQLQAWAKAISDGKAVDVHVERVRL